MRPLETITEPKPVWERKRENFILSVNTLTRPLGTGFSKETVQGRPSLGSIPKSVRYSFLLFVFTFPFEFAELPYITEGNFSLANLTGLIFFAFYLFHLGVPFRKVVPGVQPAMGWLLGYVLTYVLGGLFVIDEGFGLDYLVRFTTVIQLVVFLWCASDLLKDQRLAKSCLLSLSAAVVILAIGSLLHLPGFVPEIQKRTTALDMNPNRVAYLMVCAAIILIGFCLNESHWSTKRKWFALILCLPVLVFLVSTGSRAGIGGVIIGISIFFFAHGGLKRKITASLLACAGIAVVLVFVINNPVASDRWARFIEHGHTAGRDVIWEHALEMIGEKPILGWGRAAFDELGFRLGLMGSRDAHNFILYLLLEVGLIGTVPFLIGVCLCLLAAWKARAGPLGILPLALLVSLLAMMMTHTGLRAKAFWLFLALALAAAAPGGRRIRGGAFPNSSFGIAPRKAVARYPAR